ERPIVQAALPAGIQPAPTRLDAWEVWSGPDPSRVAERLREMMALVQAGAALVPVAGVDPLLDPRATGGPRTCFSQAVSQRPLREGDSLRQAVRRGDVVVTNGPWLRVTANGAEPGQLASAPEGRVRLRITVLAAPAVDVRELEVWVGP